MSCISCGREDGPPRIEFHSYWFHPVCLSSATLDAGDIGEHPGPYSVGIRMSGTRLKLVDGLATQNDASSWYARLEDERQRVLLPY